MWSLIPSSVLTPDTLPVSLDSQQITKLIEKTQQGVIISQHTPTPPALISGWLADFSTQVQHLHTTWNLQELSILLQQNIKLLSTEISSDAPVATSTITMIKIAVIATSLMTMHAPIAILFDEWAPIHEWVRTKIWHKIIVINQDFFFYVANFLVLESRFHIIHNIVENPEQEALLALIAELDATINTFATHSED